MLNISIKEAMHLVECSGDLVSVEYDKTNALSVKDGTGHTLQDPCHTCELK
jgi:hypothetical protein